MYSLLTRNTNFLVILKRVLQKYWKTLNVKYMYTIKTIHYQIYKITWTTSLSKKPVVSASGEWDTISGSLFSEVNMLSNEITLVTQSEEYHLRSSLIESGKTLLIWNEILTHVIEIYQKFWSKGFIFLRKISASLSDS